MNRTCICGLHWKPRFTIVLKYSMQKDTFVLLNRWYGFLIGQQAGLSWSLNQDWSSHDDDVSDDGLTDWSVNDSSSEPDTRFSSDD